MMTPDSTPGAGDAPWDETAEREHRFHTYISNAIPWYVRLIWVLFYSFAAWYILVNLFPAIQMEFKPGPTRPTIGGSQPASP